MPLLEELVLRHQLLDPVDRSPFVIHEGRVLSSAGHDHGPVAGPLNFLDVPPPADISRVPPGDVEKMRAALELPPTPAVREEIARAIAATGVTLQDAHLSAEARMLAERFRIENFASQVRDVEDASAARSEAGAIELLSHSVGEMLTAGREVYRSVRVRNAGPGWLTQADCIIETDWISSAGSSEKGLLVGNELPVDLAPGREITLMLRIRTPSRPDHGVVRFALRRRGKGSPPFLEQPAQVVLFDPPVFEYEFHPPMLDYEGDHRVAAEELSAYLASRYGGRAATLLEIGSGVHPAGIVAVHGGHRLVATDVSPAQCILGSLYFRHALPAGADSLGFLSCDGTRLPFADGAFDGVLLFAAFHHFAEPLALLAEARRVIRDGGFIYIACDCCTPDPRDKEYVMEVRRGINEQVWTLPEYATFFRTAGLRVSRARIDFNSLKVFVVKDGGPAPAEADAQSVRVIARLYRDVLGRAPDAEGAGYWASRVAGGESLPRVVEAFMQVAEARQAWWPLLRAALAKGEGVPFEALAEAVQLRRAGADDAAVASRLGIDEEALRRAADASEVDATHVEITLAYATLLRRLPDPEGLAYWRSADVPIEAVIASLLASGEYRNRAD
jgi:SAM-dependent methyltransferase